ncbi:unnamed protein product [Psylliodes chrysocephalus]|uniref:Uncharacterized protein n=1 Tax=Psylliodes chrysocephalus TaxID=3402493 RepID=A0A9P0GCE3_9CUCU|nr:unnamed protein product [Psylliodes chrysocephala]
MISAIGSNDPQKARLARQEDVASPEDQDSRQTRKRKWPKKDNVDIMRAYFIGTKCELSKQVFRKKTLIEWRRLRPDLNLTESQLANQLYAIRTHNLLTVLEIAMVKEEKRQTTNRDIQNGTGKN